MDPIKEMLDTAADDTPVVPLDLASTRRRGTQLRRRRTALRAAGSVLALTALGGLAIGGVTVLSPSTGGSLPVGGPVVQAPASPAKPTPPASSSPTAEERTPATKQELAALGTWLRPQILALLEPYGTATISEEWSGDTHYGINVILDDGDGPTNVQVFVYRAGDPKDSSDLREEFRPCTPGTDANGTCTKLPAGAFLWTTKPSGYAENDSRHTSEYANLAMLTRADRAVISISAWNGPGEKKGATRSKPALTIAQVKAAVTDAVWDEMPLPN